MTVLFILLFYPRPFLFFLRNKSCSCTTCIVYVNLFKDRFFYVGFLFRKADAKVKTFKYIFQIFSEVFFHLSFFPSSLLRKGEQKKGCFTDPDSRKSVNQRCLLFESGCKGKNFISYLPNKSEVFFIFLFKGGSFERNSLKGKEKSKGSYSVSVRMSIHRRSRSRKRMQK